MTWQVSGVSTVVEELKKAKAAEEEKARKEAEARQAILDKQREAQAALQVGTAASNAILGDGHFGTCLPSICTRALGTGKQPVVN